MSTPSVGAARLLRTLGDDTRLQILALIRQRELCVCELVALFPISQPAVSGHLRRLKDAGLIEDERRGMWVYYRARRELPPLVSHVLDEIELPPTLSAALQGGDSTTCCQAMPAPAQDHEPQTADSHVARRPPPAAARRGLRDPAHRRGSA